MATTIDTRANVKTRLGISSTTDDTLLDSLLETADYQIRVYVGGRTFPAAAASITEDHAGNQPFIQVNRPPITSVTSIKVDTLYGFGTDITALTANRDYVIRSAAAGIVQCLYSQAWVAGLGFASSLKTLDGIRLWSDYPGVVRIVYVGDGPASDDVKQAFALLVLHHYQIQKREVATGYKRLAFSNDGTNQYQRTGRDEGKLAVAGMPAIVQALLAPYRRRPL